MGHAGGEEGEGGRRGSECLAHARPDPGPNQAHAKVLGEAMGKGAYAEADRGFGYSLASS